MKHPNPKYPCHLNETTDDSKLNYFLNGFSLSHPKIEDVLNTMLSVSTIHSSGTIWNITGSTGVGKSHLADRFLKELDNGCKHTQEYDSTIPAVFIEAPAHGLGFDWKDFYLRILNELNEDDLLKKCSYKVPDKNTYGRKYTTSSRKEVDLRGDVERSFIDYKVKNFVVDESQHLFKYSGGNGERNLDALKSLINLSGVSLYLLGTYETMFSIDWSGQLSRRGQDIHFSNYRYQNDKEYKEFVSSVSGLLAHIPFEFDESIVEDIEFLYCCSCGCIGVLKEHFDRALKKMIHDGECVLRRKHLEFEKLPNRKLKRIAEEMREGVAYFDEPELSEVMALLVDSQKNNMSEQVSNKPVSGNKRPGERKIGRDLIYVQ